MSELTDFFERASRRTEDALERIIPPATSIPARLYDAVRWSVFAGGKRFRPALTFAVGDVFGVEPDKLMTMAAAIEMIHTYSLIHDDLPAMDDDDLRRGRATCHVKFDEATAILAGDVLQSLAFRAITADQTLAAETRLRLVAELADAATRMVDGQQLDLDGEGKSITVSELENIHRNKTGAMIAVSARAGAIIGGANQAELTAVTRYAENLGLLFQITDDLLDISQTTETLGKTAGKDVAADKATYPALLGFDGASERAREVHDAAIGAVAAVGRPAGMLVSLADFILSRRK